MVAFLEGDKLMTIDGKGRCESSEYTRQRVTQNNFSVLNYIIIDRGNMKVDPCKVCALDIEIIVTVWYGQTPVGGVQYKYTVRENYLGRE